MPDLGLQDMEGMEGFGDEDGDYAAATMFDTTCAAPPVRCCCTAVVLLVLCWCCVATMFATLRSPTGADVAHISWTGI